MPISVLLKFTKDCEKYLKMHNKIHNNVDTFLWIMWISLCITSKHLYSLWISLILKIYKKQEHAPKSTSSYSSSDWPGLCPHTRLLEVLLGIASLLTLSIRSAGLTSKMRHAHYIIFVQLTWVLLPASGMDLQPQTLRNTLFSLTDYY